MAKLMPLQDRFLLTPVASQNVDVPMSPEEHQFVAYTVLDVGPDVKDKRIKSGAVVYCDWTNKLRVGNQEFESCSEHCIQLILTED